MPRTAPPTQIGAWQAIPTLREPRYSQSLERALATITTPLRTPPCVAYGPGSS
jgi:hypothetical protein